MIQKIALLLVVFASAAYAGGPLCAPLSDEGASDLALIAAFEKRTEKELERDWLAPAVNGWLAQRASQIRAEVSGKLTNDQIIDLIVNPLPAATPKNNPK